MAQPEEDPQIPLREPYNSFKGETESLNGQYMDPLGVLEAASSNGGGFDTCTFPKRSWICILDT